MKKRILSIILVLTLACCFCVTGCAKREEKSTKGTVLTVSSKDAKIGKNVEIPVKISGNPGIMALLIDFKYDSELLEYVDYEKGDIFSDYEISENNGNLKLICLENNDVKGNGELLTLKFKVIAKKACKTDVEVVIEDNSICNFDEKLIPATGKKGTINIKK